MIDFEADAEHAAANINRSSGPPSATSYEPDSLDAFSCRSHGAPLMAVLFTDAGGDPGTGFFICVATASDVLAAVPTVAQNINEAELNAIALALHFAEDEQGTIFNDSTSAVAMARGRGLRGGAGTERGKAIAERLPPGWSIHWVPRKYNRAHVGVQQIRQRFTS